MIYVWIIAGLMLASGLLQVASVAALRRRVGQLEQQSRNRPTAEETRRYTEQLERAMGLDLDGLPPHVRTIIRLYREVTRHHA